MSDGLFLFLYFFQCVGQCYSLDQISIEETAAQHGCLVVEV